MRNSRVFLCGVFLICAALSASRAEEAAIIPRQVLFGGLSIGTPRLSPDGTRVAYLASEEGALNVWVRTLGQSDDRAVTHNHHRGVTVFAWAPDGKQILFVQDREGNENWHVWIVPVEGGDEKDLTPAFGARGQIIAVEPQIPDEVLVGVTKPSSPGQDVYRIDLRTGERELDTQNTIQAVGWTVDHDLNVRLAQVGTPEGGLKLLQRRGTEWKEVLEWSAEDAPTVSIRGFAGDNQRVYLITAEGSNAAELRALDLKTGAQKTIASDPDYDAQDVLIDPQTHDVQAVAFYRERLEWKALDPAIQPHLDATAKLGPGMVRISDRAAGNRAWLVGIVQDRGPISFYSYEPSTRQGAFLFSHRSDLADLPLAGMTPVSFQARDGLALHGYLTLPAGREAKNLPAVLLVHGGPWSRDVWGFNPEVQWLANRGYACLQVNFRGSSGYGKKFMAAGDREWGRKMEDDLADGGAWLISQGIADSRRIGILGSSYGGFAALSGLARAPDLYACGVSLCGPINLITYIRSIPPFRLPLVAMFEQRVGHPEKDADSLRARSPMTRARRIRAPLLLAQGARDPRVDPAELAAFRDSLQASGVTVEYLEFPDEGPNLQGQENRLHFYARAEKFLAKYLGGRAEEERVQE